MATAKQIRETAAENLGILAQGETLQSAEVADLDQAYIEVYNELQGLNLTTWAVADDVPDKYSRSIAMLVAESRAVKYQVAEAKYQRIKLESQQAIALIRELQAPAKMGTTEIENF
jgi:hypothetical protein